MNRVFSDEATQAVYDSFFDDYDIADAYEVWRNFYNEENTDPDIIDDIEIRDLELWLIEYYNEYVESIYDETQNMLMYKLATQMLELCDFEKVAKKILYM